MIFRDDSPSPLQNLNENLTEMNKLKKKFPWKFTLHKKMLKIICSEFINEHINL